MAYEVGTAYLSIVPSFGSNFSRLIGNAGQDVQRGLGQAGAAAGEQAGGLFSGTFGKIMKGGAIVGSVAALGGLAGAAFSKTFGAAMDREATTAKQAASLGISDDAAKANGAAAGRLYAAAYGDSFEGVQEAITTVQSSLKGLDGAELETATKNALNFSDAFGVDMARSVQSVSTLIGSGLVKDSAQAFDVLTAASQKVPAALREDVLDASDEYGQFFHALGFDATQAFGALSSASDKGAFGIDKTGDAIKEFTIRATDMSASTTGAFTSIGLDAQTMANDLLAGGDTAASAMQSIVSGLQGIKDPATQANTAIALFGTPLEDLGVSNIPQFLASLNGATGGLGDFEGAAAAVDAKLGGTIQAKWTTFTRTVGGLGSSLTDSLLPAFGPVLDGLTHLATAGSEQIDKLGVKFTAQVDVVKGKASEFWSGLTMDASTRAEFEGQTSGFVEFGSTIRGVFEDVLSTVGPIFQEVGSILGPAVVDVFNTLKPAVMQLVPVFTQLLPLFNPVSLIFHALLPILPQLADVVGQLARVLGEALAKAVSALAPLFETVVGVIQRLLPFVTRLVTSLLPPLMGLFDKLAPILDAVLGALLPVVDAIIAALIPAIDALMPVVETVFGFIAATITNVMTVVGGVIDVLTGVFTGDWSKVWTGIQEIFGGVWDQIKNILSTAWNLIQEIFTSIGPTLLGIITGFAGKLAEWGSDFLGWLFDGIKSMAVNVFSWFGSLPGWIWEKITALTSTIVGYGTKFLQWIWDGITGLFPQVLTWFSNLPATAWAGVVALTSTIIGYGSSFITWIKDGIVSGAQGIWDFVTDLPNRIGTLLAGLGTKLIQLGKDLVGKIVEGVASVASTIWDAITKALTGDGAGLPTDSLTGASGGVTPGGIARGGLVARAGGGMMEFTSAENRYGRRWALPNGYISGPGGPTQDAIPTWLSDGEYVNRAKSVDKYYGALDALNRDNPAAAMDYLLPHLATGGVVGTMAAAKAYGASEAWKRANELIEASKTAAAVGSNGNWGPVNMSGFAANTAAAKSYIESHFSGVSSIGGLYGGSVSGSDHPYGKALDVMIANYLSQQGIAAGSKIADWFIQNPNSFGTKYVIWRDRINQGGQWKPYSHPAGNNDTLAHRDHVHISFLTGSGDFSANTVPVGDTPKSMAGLLGKAQAKLGVGSAVAGFNMFGPGGPAAVSGGVFPPNVERWRPTVMQSLALLRSKGLDGNPAYANTVLNQVRTESSGNENAANLTDSNARRGDPSIGLVQVIRSTFESMLQRYGFADLIPLGQRNPLASLVAGELWSIYKYKSIPAGMRGVAYAKGGIVPGFPSWGQDSVPGMLTPGEGVFTAPETNAIITHAKALEKGYAGDMPQPQVTINLNSADPLQAAVAQMLTAGLDAEARDLVRLGAQS